MKIALIAGIFLLVGAAIEGISETQIDSYTNALDSANDLQEKVNNSNKNALDKLEQLQTSD